MVHCPVLVPGRGKWCHVPYHMSWTFTLSEVSSFVTSISSVQLLSRCLTLCDPMDHSMPGFPVHHQLPELAQTHVHQVGDAIQYLILCRPLLLPPSIFPSIRVFSKESVLCIRWPKYWSIMLQSIMLQA